MIGYLAGNHDEEDTQPTYGTEVLAAAAATITMTMITTIAE